MATYNEDASRIISKIGSPGVSSKELRHIYENWAENYDEHLKKHLENKGTPQVARKLCEVLGDRKDAKVIDLCAGTGNAGGVLKEFGFNNLCALDASQAMMDVAQKKGIYQSFICDYLGPNKLQIENGTYDASLLAASFMMNHANDSCFEEVIRILKPGGYFVFSITLYSLGRPGFEEFESRIQQLESAGLWKRISVDIIPNSVIYMENETIYRDAKLFVMQKQ